MTGLRLVIFDVDGTLVDSQNEIWASMQAAYAAHGLPAPERLAVLGIVGLSLDAAFARLSPHLGGPARGDLAAAYQASYAAMRERNGIASSPLYPGARDILDRLHGETGTLLGVATGKSRRGLGALMALHGLERYFVSLQTADDHPSKPHPSMIQACLAEVGIHASRAVMVGDTRYDMEMGRAAGVRTIGVPWGPARDPWRGRDRSGFRAVAGHRERPAGACGMSEWQRKRFWKRAATTRTDGGFSVVLDDRPVRTPSKAPFDLPSRALAEAVAIEWDAQQGVIDPESMPLTRLANSALDKVAVQHGAVAGMLAEYGANDLLCYRATGPEGLVERQAEHWDALLDWAAADLGIRLRVQSGVMPITQPDASLSEISRRTMALDSFDLMALHEMVTLSGSWVIGYAALTNARPAEALWQTALIDELWQEEHWGRDDEAAAAREARGRAFLVAHHFGALAREDRRGAGP